MKKTLIIALCMLMYMRAAYGNYLGWVWLPDFHLYTQGGIGIWPSIPGRLIGSMGEYTFSLLSIFCSALIIPVLYVATKRNGYSGIWAIVGLTLSPASIYLSYTGIDPIALLIFTIGLAGIYPIVTMTIASITHFSLVPYGALEIWRKSPNWQVVLTICFFGGIPVLIALLLTPYSGIIYNIFSFWFPIYFFSAFVLGIILSIPFMFIVKIRAFHLTALGAGAMLSAMQGHLQVRYMLPAVIIISLESVSPLTRWGGLMK